MAHVLNDADYRLTPPHSLSRETAPFKMNNAVDWKLDFSKEFPYDFGRWKSELSSPVASRDAVESEDDDFFSELNRRLAFFQSEKVSPLDLRQPSEMPNVCKGSPQSILGGIGSWSGRSSNESHQSPLQSPSPPATPYEAKYDTAGFIYAAAGQVERLKISTEGPLKPTVNAQFKAASNTKSEPIHLPTSVTNHQAADALAEQNYLAAARRAYHAALLYEHHLQNLNNFLRHSRSVAGKFTQSPLMSIQRPQSRLPTTPNFQSAPLQRKESVGTGVFLPRRYNNPTPTTPPRKKAVTPSPIVSSKVVQALNISFEEMNSLSQPHYSAYAASMSQKNYEALMARRNAFLAQQQRRVAIADELVQSSLEVCLPHEWSY